MSNGQSQNPTPRTLSLLGPAATPTSDSLTTLGSDPDLAIKLVDAGSRATQAGFEQAKANRSKEPKNKWVLLILYLAVITVILVIYSLPSTTTDLKNNITGFLFGQLTLLISLFSDKKGKE
jgi:hypothetical protein